MDKIYACIDLKSFYASVECKERGLDPITTNLVVADKNRTQKTICLAVSPSLKKYGLPGRARLFEVVQRVKEINVDRKCRAPKHSFVGSSYSSIELNKNPGLALDYIVATPRMSYYMKYSTMIYNVYLQYLSKDDIYVYSVDEIFCDLTKYLKTYKLTAEELVTKMIQDVYKTTGITATGGIGTNLYLAKIAMDIVAKHIDANKDGVRIAYLDEMLYRKLLWNHRPLRDFWRVGKGYAKKLEANNMFTMGDVARCSIVNEELLYKLFGINAELLIDHSWGWEPCTMKDIKSFKPSRNSISSGQVLHCAYDYDRAKLIVREMADQLVLDMVSKKLLTNQMVLTVGYDIDNIKIKSIRAKYDGEITIDRYGREVPKHAHGTINLKEYTASTKIIVDAVMELFDRIINKDLLVRRVYVIANNVIVEQDKKQENKFEQLDMFTDYKKLEEEEQKREIKLKKEQNLQKAVLDIKKKYGKNAILKGMNFLDGGTMRDRNSQIGGHKA